MLILLIFNQVFRREFFEGFEVEGTFLVHAFVDVEMLTVFLLDKDAPAIRAYKRTDFEVCFILIESESADFTQELAASSGIVVDICMRGATTLADSIRRDRVVSSWIHGFEILSVLGLILMEQLFVVEFLRLLNDRESVHGKLIVLGACKIVFWRF